MKNIFRISLVLVLALLLSISLFSCNDPVSDDPKEEQSTTNDQTADESDTKGESESQNDGNGGGSEEESTTEEQPKGGLENKGNLSSDGLEPLVPVR